MKKISKLLFILTAVFMVVTIICIVLLAKQSMDTSTDLSTRLEINKNKSMAEWYKSNNDIYKYEQMMEEVEEAEEQLEREKNIASIISWSPYVAGGITVTLLAVAIILRKKSK